MFVCSFVCLLSFCFWCLFVFFADLLIECFVFTKMTICLLVCLDLMLTIQNCPFQLCSVALSYFLRLFSSYFFLFYLLSYRSLFFLFFSFFHIYRVEKEFQQRMANISGQRDKNEEMQRKEFEFLTARKEDLDKQLEIMQVK